MSYDLVEDIETDDQDVFLLPDLGEVAVSINVVPSRLEKLLNYQQMKKWPTHIQKCLKSLYFHWECRLLSLSVFFKRSISGVDDVDNLEK